MRNVDAAGGRALLTLVLEAAADDRDRERLRIGARMGDDEILAARLADNARIRAIAVRVRADLLPHQIEHRRAAGEVQPGEIAVRERSIRDRHRIARKEVDHARRQPCLREDLHHVVRAQHRRHRRLPEHRVAHERGRGGEIASDRREIERRYRVDESLQRAIVRLVPDAAIADRLIRVEVLREVHVEAPEVGELARGVDLRLERRFRLAEHRGRVQRRPISRGQQLGGAQEDAGALLEGPVAPVRPRALGGLDRLRDMLGGGRVPGGEHVLVRVRHHDLRGVAGANLAAADHDRNVHLLGGHRGESCLELGALGRAGCVAPDRLVHGRRRTPGAVEPYYGSLGAGGAWGPPFRLLGCRERHGDHRRGWRFGGGGGFGGDRHDDESLF